jgi:hypothetical protein
VYVLGCAIGGIGPRIKYVGKLFDSNKKYHFGTRVGCNSVFLGKNWNWRFSSSSVIF